MKDMLAHIKEMETAIADPSLEMQALFEDLKKNPPCHKAWDSLFIGWDGSASVCCVYRDSVGNVNTQSIEEMWNGKEMQRVRADFLAHNYKNCTPRCSIYAERVARGFRITVPPSRV